MITKEQAELLITLIDAMVDVKTDRTTATEESATWSLEEREAEAERELMGTITLMNGDVEAYKVLRKGGYVVGEHASGASVNCRGTPTPIPPEQSGCRKEDTQECDHNWIIAPGLFIAEGHKDNVPGSRFCCECGAREWDDPGYEPKAYAQKCKHEWEYYYPNGEEHRRCAKCGVITE